MSSVTGTSRSSTDPLAPEPGPSTDPVGTPSRRRDVGRAVLAPRAAGVAVYLAVSALLLHPVLATPVIADDFANPFVQLDANGPGLLDALGYGWEGATEGVSFRLVGNLVGSAYGWIWLTLSARFGIGMESIYAMTKFVVLVAAAQTAALVWFRASRVFGRRIPFVTASVLVSLVFFGTLQLHGAWSNDPVGSYPLAGYGSAILGLLVLAAAIRCVEAPRPRSFAIATVAALVAVLYYEANVGSVVGAAIIVAAAAWRGRHLARGWRPLVYGGVVMVLVPAATILYGRTVTAARADQYSGTSTRLGGAPRAVLVGIGSSVPGAAWRLSQRTLGGQVGLVFIALAIVALVVWVVRWWWSTTPPMQGSIEAGPGGALRGWSVALACGVLAAFVVCLQAITVKLQQEAPTIGYVYTAYAYTSLVVALAVAVGVAAVLRRPGHRDLKFLACMAAVGFVLVQTTVNWRLSAHLNQTYAANRRLLDAFDDDVDAPRRCQALLAWRDLPWPAYYEEGVTDGLQGAFEYYHRQPFCEGVGSGA